jgi:hypothetical protein
MGEAGESFWTTLAIKETRKATKMRFRIFGFWHEPGILHIAIHSSQ